MIYTLKTRHPFGSWWECAGFKSAKLTWEFNDVGSAELEYYRRGVDAEQIVEDAEIVLFANGIEQPNSRWRVYARTGDDTPGSETFTVKALGKLNDLSYSLVFPRNEDWDDPKPWNWKSATQGKILSDLWSQMVSRAAEQGLTKTFSATHDSLGVPWNRSDLRRKIPPGTKFTTVLRSMRDRGLINFWLNGTELVVTNFRGLGRDRSGDVVLTAGIDYTEAPWATDTTQRVTHVAIKGDDGSWAFLDDLINMGQQGRRKEIVVTQDGTRNQALLLLAGGVYLENVRNVKEQLTRRIQIEQDTPQWPVLDYTAGDWIYDDVNGRVRKEQIQVLTLNLDGSGDATADITMKDQLLDGEVARAKRLEALVEDASSGIDSGTPKKDKNDEDAPNPPTGLSIDSELYRTKGNDYHALAVVTWNRPERDEDGPKYRDHSHYAFHWRYSTEPDNKWRKRHSKDEDLVLSNLDCGRTIVGRVRAHDVNGNHSEWSVWKNEQLPDNPLLPPGTIRGLAASSSRYRRKTGGWDAVAVVSWDALPDDLEFYPNNPVYQVSWKYASQNKWASVVPCNDLDTELPGLDPGKTINIRVRALNKNNQPGPWSYVSHELENSNVPPPVPTAPIVTVDTNDFRIRWDGNFIWGLDAPADFKLVQVHVSSQNNFEPTTATREGTLSGKGTTREYNYAPGTWRFKFVAVDRHGNKSDPSAEVDAVISS